MFGKPSEAEKVVALRKAAREAFGNHPPLSEYIRLKVIVHVGPVNNRMTGDLDNFITGICDSLMAAHSNAKIAHIFNRPELTEIYPSRAIGLLDDSQVIDITAQKIIGDTEYPWYEIVIEGT